MEDKMKGQLYNAILLQSSPMTETHTHDLGHWGDNILIYPVEQLVESSDFYPPPPGWVTWLLDYRSISFSLFLSLSASLTKYFIQSKVTSLGDWRKCLGMFFIWNVLFCFVLFRFGERGKINFSVNQTISSSPFSVWPLNWKINYLQSPALKWDVYSHWNCVLFGKRNN